MVRGNDEKDIWEKSIKMNYKKYYKLKFEKELINENISMERRLINKKLRLKYFDYFKIMNIMIVFMFIFNFGAIAITNYLVVEKSALDNEPILFLEASKETADKYGYEHIDKVTMEGFGNKILFQMFLHALILSVVWVVYLFYKHFLFHEIEIYVMFFLITFTFVTLGIDFFNNLGYYLGYIKYN